MCCAGWYFLSILSWQSPNGNAKIPSTGRASSQTYDPHFLQYNLGTLLPGGIYDRMFSSLWKITFSGLNPAAPTNAAPPALLQSEQWQ